MPLLICVVTLTYTSKTAVKSVPHTVVKESYQLKSDDSYFKQCMKSVECKWLTEMGYHESRSESDKGVAAVMYVVLNRAKHPSLWPSTVKGVITQKSQFSYRFDGSLEKGFTDKKQYRRIAVIAQKVVSGEIASPVGSATHYHTTSISPYWSKVKRKVVQIGNHVFRQ